MPNWCDNQLTIYSSDKQLLTDMAEAAKKGELLAFLRPEPDYSVTPVAKTFFDENGDKTPSIREDAWWDWRIQNWGTKWDIDTDPDLVNLDLEGGTITCSFSTAWSPPIAALNWAAEERGIDFQIYYYEPGIPFCGYATPSQDDCYDIPDDVESIKKTIPGDILDMFPIVECAEEYEMEE